MNALTRWMEHQRGVQEVSHLEGEITDQGDRFMPRNRAERRLYNKHVTTTGGLPRRYVRLHVVGFGRWRRHRYLSRAAGKIEGS